MTETAPSDVKDVLKKGLATYDIDVVDDVKVISSHEDKYKVEVPYDGELLFDNILSNYGTLLYNKEGEIDWKGVRSGKLVVTVDLDN
ncbi:hypothetical protein [Natrinema hispanicum]|uniref:Uncharacterized protein n=1 Tax=Natrinema hispanicum TaxID=392421 RepID=A0A1G6VMK5_9EURY|nr:hypothetical protein [Natrinema hispanicum]SDD54819.1 hypothetical protein SAMN05192552_10302 [Natrinema hispanicum]